MTSFVISKLVYQFISIAVKCNVIKYVGNRLIAPAARMILRAFGRLRPGKPPGLRSFINDAAG